MRFIGDVHGKMDKYRAIALEGGISIQLGDFGAGFVSLPNMPDGHRFIRGNHDSPDVCRQSPNWIIDGCSEDGMFFLGGAHSIDKHRRIPGVSWWEDEELSYGELERIIDDYAKERPEVVISHTCPLTVISDLFGARPIGSRTEQAMSAMLDVHKPDLWIFGHWHKSVNKVIDGTRFICLAELEWMDI